jgi:CheY-like chemotaxis protein
MKRDEIMYAETNAGEERLAERRDERSRLLLADDSPQIRESLSKVLRQAGYFVVPVAHGGQVLDRVLTERFDVLLLDLNMAGMDGWETLERLALFKPELPVIIITAHSGQRDWAEAEGARALLEKPLDIPELLGTIAKLLSGDTIHAQPDSAIPVQEFRFVPPRPREALQVEMGAARAIKPSGCDNPC